MRIGILCPSEIAYRRFLPALQGLNNVQFVGLAVNSIEERYGDTVPDENTVKNMLFTEHEKANRMTRDYGGTIFESYEKIVSSSDIDAIYIPLPPALHFKWALKALEQGKHVLVEKPATIAYSDTEMLIQKAKNKNLALHENYMFTFHNQLTAIRSIIRSGELGEIRLYRISFGFPRRDSTDFRYSMAMGGGALLDAGGYTIKCADWLLDGTSQVIYAALNHISGFEVDMYGSGALINHEGTTAQISFGMDNEYKCELEVWGSKGTLTTNRIMTAPAGFIPKAIIKKGNDVRTIELEADDAFQKSILHFMESINDPYKREKNYKDINRQAKLVDDFMRASDASKQYVR